MPDDAPINGYDAFWLFYLREHSRPRTRALHYSGSVAAVAGIVAFVLSGNIWFLAAAPIAGYGPAWVAHYTIEQNHPTTFSHPLWSTISDFRMAFAWVTGQIGDELKRAGVAARS